MEIVSEIPDRVGPSRKWKSVQSKFPPQLAKALEQEITLTGIEQAEIIRSAFIDYAVKHGLLVANPK